MKHVFILLLALTMCLSLAACDNTVTAEPSGKEPADTAPQIVNDVYRQLVEYAQNGQYADAWRLVMQNPELKEYEDGNEYFEYCRGMRAFETGAMGTAYEILSTVPHILDASKVLFVIEERIHPLNGHYVSDNGKGSYLHLVIKDGKIASGLVGYYDDDQTFSYTEEDFQEELVVSKYTNGTEFIGMGRYYSNVSSEITVEYVISLFDDTDDIMVLKYEGYDYNTFNGMYEKVKEEAPEQNPGGEPPVVEPPIIEPDEPATEEPETECAHDWQLSDCESPLTCSKCGESGEVPGHTWTEATCGVPKTCGACGETEGEPTGDHTVNMNNGFCNECGQYAYDVTFIANEILSSYNGSDSYCVAIKWACYVESPEKCNCLYCSFDETSELGEAFFSLVFCVETFYKGEYDTYVGIVTIHKCYDPDNDKYYNIWYDPTTNSVVTEKDENGNISHIKVEYLGIDADLDELQMVDLSCENGHTMSENSEIWPSVCIICGKKETSEDYIYLAQTVFRSVQREYSNATPNFAFVSLYKDTNGDVCVAIHLNYKIISDYEQEVLYNLTQGKTIKNPTKYYKNLANNSYGATKIRYMELQNDFLEALIADSAVILLKDQIDPS